MRARLNYAKGSSTPERNPRRHHTRRNSIDKIGNEAMKVFIKADTSGDGVLQREEMPAMLEGMGISGKAANRLKDLISVFFDDEHTGLGQVTSVCERE